jgi:hypothetical protein
MIGRKKREEQIKKLIDDELDNVLYDRSDLKDVAYKVSSKFRMLLTPGEIKDIHRSGF